MNFVLFDSFTRDNLLPLTFTRPVAEIRIGILTIKEKWEHFLKNDCSYYTSEYLSEKYKFTKTDENIFINASVIPDKQLVEEIISLKEDESLHGNGCIIAIKTKKNNFIKDPETINYDFKEKKYEKSFLKINNLWDIFLFNAEAIKRDFEILTSNRKSQIPDKSNGIINAENIFIEEGSRVRFSILNAESGPIYIGKNAEIMENSAIRGPFALCNDSTVKMSSKIYGATTIGPYSKVGGEINNSVIFGYSNKAHDGFLGNSVIGEWCNLGADTNNSNLKNNYAEVRLWNYSKESFINTGLQFCGLIMGDHSKCGINTMFNTGTVVGVSANIFGAGFLKNFIPSFSWGGQTGMTEYSLTKAFETIDKVFERRSLSLTEIDRKILQAVFNLTEKYRKF